jgi:glycine betaine catabolism B
MITIFLRPYRYVQAVIDRTAMYMLVLYMLSALSLCSLIFGALGLVAYGMVSQLLSFCLIICVAYGSSLLLAFIRKVPANHHSSIITGLILFFLILPATTVTEYIVLAGTVVVAIASKYIFVYRKQHLFNAAALAVFLLSLSGFGAASWWVATPWLLPPLLITGSIVVIKIRKWELCISFLVAGFAVFIFEGLYYGDEVASTWSMFFLSYPALFLGFFMLTEPFSMPPTKKTQMMYGALVGVLSNTSLLKPVLSMTPELALLIGNLAAYPLTLKRKLTLVVQSVREIAMWTYEVTFIKPAGLRFVAGQYLEWMLPHSKFDSRGIRRYFTVAASPTEEVLRVAVKIPEVASTYKQKLQSLKEGDIVIASQLAGDFVLPTDTSKKIAMVAGGIGVTPFRSHLQFLADTNDQRDVALFYCNNTIEEAAYSAEFARYRKNPILKIVYVFAKAAPSHEYESGYFNADVVTKHTPDYKERVWYISGPPIMVASAATTLRTLGVPIKQIKKDFFPGLG